MVPKKLAFPRNMLGEEKADAWDQPERSLSPTKSFHSSGNFSGHLEGKTISDGSLIGRTTC